MGTQVKRQDLKLKTTIILVFLLTPWLLFLACKEPGGVQEPSEQLTVQVQLVGNTIQVHWTPVKGTEKYQISRKEGASVFNNIATIASGNVTSYDDTTYPQDVVLQYSVTAIPAISASLVTGTSSTISKYVLRLEASRLTYNDRIVISWAGHDAADEYVVYRSESRDTNASTKKIGKTTDKKYVDNVDNVDPIVAPVSNTPYYYWVTWKDAEAADPTVEYGLPDPDDSEFVLGVFSSQKDPGEPNNEKADVELQTTSCIFDKDQPPLIYSFNDGAGSVETDTDWYKFFVSPLVNYVVKVTFPASTPFKDGQLLIQFLGDGWPISEQFIYTSDPELNTYNITIATAVTPNPAVYFKIFPVGNSDSHLIGSYFVEISNEL